MKAIVDHLTLSETLHDLCRFWFFGCRISGCVCFDHLKSFGKSDFFPSEPRTFWCPVNSTCLHVYSVRVMFIKLLVISWDLRHSYYRHIARNLVRKLTICHFDKHSHQIKIYQNQYSGQSPNILPPKFLVPRSLPTYLLHPFLHLLV